VDDLRATKSEDAELIARAISFQDFQPMWSWSTDVTDRQTDRRTDDMQSQDHAFELYCIAWTKKTIHRVSKKSSTLYSCPYLR